MTDPRPVRMWAIYDPQGKWLFRILESYKSHAWAAAETITDETPQRLRKHGYRCIRVTITPDHESEK